MPYKVILVGTGGQGRAWCQNFLPPNIQDGLVEVVAAVDVNPAALKNAQEYLGLAPAQCYTELQPAFAENPADFAVIVTPPAYHEAVVDIALAHDLHILSEKPIADTLEGSVRIAEKVKRAGKKMGVTMSHRFDQDKTTLRQELRSGRNGAIDYLICRFTCNMRNFGDWGAHFRHTMKDALMIEGAVHHLDILADLAGAPCDTLYAQTWNPAWGEYGGDSQGLVTMHFENGVRAVYEGAKTNAVGLNGWAQEYVRVECEKATLIMDRRRVERHPYEGGRIYKREGEGIELPLLEQAKWRNSWLVEQFVQWLDGGPAMETHIEANLQSVALIFAAIQSSQTGQPVNVQELLAATRRQVAAAG
ncbi:MAG: Gfo/Idh/MocA family oxidoreductase [Caldilineaceae bacterium]|nr:Gfo/Idh/MocA family oxidoreductase [Caldilineaceae bacterium]